MQSTSKYTKTLLAQYIGSKEGDKSFRARTSIVFACSMAIHFLWKMRRKMDIFQTRASNLGEPMHLDLCVLMNYFHTSGLLLNTVINRERSSAKLLCGRKGLNLGKKFYHLLGSELYISTNKSSRSITEENG